MQRVLGVFDENLQTISRELALFPRVDGTVIALEGENAEIGAEVIRSLLALEIGRASCRERVSKSV